MTAPNGCSDFARLHRGSKANSPKRAYGVYGRARATKGHKSLKPLSPERARGWTALQVQLVDVIWLAWLALGARTSGEEAGPHQLLVDLTKALVTEQLVRLLIYPFILGLHTILAGQHEGRGGDAFGRWR